MSKKQLTLDNFNGAIGLRGALRLSDRWIVGAMYCEPLVGEYDDGDPDRPVVRVERADMLRTLPKGSVCIEVSLRHGLRHLCPECGRPCGIKGWETTAYRSAPVLGMESFLRVSVPKLECRPCGIFRKVRCPLVRAGTMHTKLLEEEILRLSLTDTDRSICAALSVSPTVVASTRKAACAEGLDNLVLDDVTELFIDEIQFGHGMDYVTVFSDQDHRVIFICHDHTKDALRKAAEWIESHGGDRNRVEYISMDMSPTFRSGAKREFPRATVILDRFHLVKMVNEAVDHERKMAAKTREWKESRMGRAKYTVLTREPNLDGKGRERMERIRLLFPKLAQACDLKEEFAAIFDIRDPEDARRALRDWQRRVRESGISSMIRKMGLIMSNLRDILNWFSHRISNGVAEGINNKLQKIKSAAYGFRNVDNFITLCYYRMGRLSISIRWMPLRRHPASALLGMAEPCP